jgi:hypothetical protein
MQSNCPLENILAFYIVAKECGRFPVSDEEHESTGAFQNLLKPGNPLFWSALDRFLPTRERSLET